MKQDQFKQMYGATPESFQRRVAFALKKTEEQPMKQKHTARTILITAILLTVFTAVAYAAFSSQVTAFFGKLYGKPMQEWLEQGDVATASQSFTLDGVVFTLDEVVYKNNGLYGVGIIRPQEDSHTVIIAEDYAPDAPYGYDIYGAGGEPEEAPVGAPTIAEVAKEQDSKLLVVRTLPDQIAVDGGILLTPGCIGYTLIPQQDGSIQFSFEVSDGVAIEKGDVYTLNMAVSTCEMRLDGEWMQDTRHLETWTVEIRPVPLDEMQ